MYLVYAPEGGEPQRWEFVPNRMDAEEAEAIEKRTNWDWAEFGTHLMQGSVLARRALLWTFQRRVHHTLRFEDVRFTVGDLQLEMDRDEMGQVRDQLAKLDLPDKAFALATLDAEIANAPEPSGKAPASNGG